MTASRLPKSERLCSKKTTEQLFSEGRSVFLFPFKIVFLPLQEAKKEVEYPEILISVPKRKFRRAVDRNWLKRRIRESYRLLKPTHSHVLQETEALAILYVGKEKLPFAYLKRKLEKALAKLRDTSDS